MSTKLEYGKKYVCRNGAVVGPLEKNPDPESSYKFFSNVDRMTFGNNGYCTWTEDGRWRIGFSVSEFDIVAEYHEYVWKWIYPDKEGIYMEAGKNPACPGDRHGFYVVRDRSAFRSNGWYCFLMDIPSIQMPPKQRVTKRLWLRKTEGCIITLKTDEHKAADPFYSFAYQERWISAESPIPSQEWISTNVTKEFEE